MTKRASEMIAAHYAEFVGVAGRVLSRDAQALQMQPTDLAHEAAVRIAGFYRLSVNDQKHFLSLSARVMHQVLIDEIRRMRARKRQAPQVESQWSEDPHGRLVVEALDAALIRLEEFSPDSASLVERRFFTGMTLKEIALHDGVSESTVKRQWCAARDWLAAELRAT